MAVSVVDIQVNATGATQQLRAVQQGAQATSQAVDKLNATTERSAAKLQSQGNAAQQASGKFNGLRNAIASLGAGLALRKSFVDASGLESAQSRIGLLVKNFGQLSGIQNVAADAAKKFNLNQTESLNALTDLGNRIGPTGASLKDISTVYDGFNTLLVLNKVNSQQAASATLQLNQALGSGRLAGEEFNAISEATPQLLDAVAVVMGKNRSELKKLAADGQISSAVLIKALKKIKDEGAKDLETAFGGAFGATRKFDQAIADFSATVGTELLPVLTPLINKVTEILKLFGDLPGPVKTTAAVIFGATAAFVALAPPITAAIGLLGGLKLAAIGAIGSVSTLSGALLALAGIGIVTVGVNYVVTQVGEIVGSSTAAGKSVAAASKSGLQAQLKGKSAVDRKKMLAASQKNLENDKKLATQLRLQIQMQDNLASSAGEGALPSERSKLTEIQARINTNQARIKAIQTLPITPAKPVKPELPITTGGGGVTPAGGGGGGGSGDDAAKKLEAEAKKAAETAKALKDTLGVYGIELSLKRQLYDIDNKIFKAGLDKDKETQIRLNGEKELLRINSEIGKVEYENLKPKEKTAKLTSLAYDKTIAMGNTVKELIVLDTDMATQAEAALGTLFQEGDLLKAKLQGKEQEYQKTLLINQILKENPTLIRADVDAQISKNEVLTKQIQAAEELKGLYSDIGMSIKSGVVDAIQGAIDGTKSLQQVATDLLNKIANKLLDVAVNMALFGSMSGTGTGGGLLGGLFKRANGGSVTGGSPYLVGERGPELFMPGRSGGIAPAGSFGGGTNVVVNVDATGSNVQGDDQSSKQLGVLLAAAVQKELIKQKRPGGILA
jgi:tape measure domain-containing protein